MELALWSAWFSLEAEAQEQAQTEAQLRAQLRR
jgi:hypothetical protein